MGDSSLFLIVFAHGSGFPLADAAPHQLWAVGFPNIFTLDKNIQDAHIAAIVIQVELTAPKPWEEPWRDRPATLKRESVAVLHTISMMGRLAIHRFHEQQLQIIG